MISLEAHRDLLDHSRRHAAFVQTASSKRAFSAAVFNFECGTCTHSGARNVLVPYANLAPSPSRLASYMTRFRTEAFRLLEERRVSV